jgi:hypothetical protein
MPLSDEPMTPESSTTPDHQPQTRDLRQDGQAEIHVHARAAQLRHVLSDSPFMLTRCSRDLRYVFVNRA